MKGPLNTACSRVGHGTMSEQSGFPVSDSAAELSERYAVRYLLASVVLKRVGEVAANDLSSSDAVIVGSSVYFANMSGEIKTFFDNWSLKFDLFKDRKMRNKVGTAFSTGAFVSAGKEFTILGILAGCSTIR